MDKMRNQVEKTRTMTLTDKGYRERLIENLPSNKYSMLKLNVLTEKDKNKISIDELKLQILNYYEMIEETNKSNEDMAFNIIHKNKNQTIFNQDWCTQFTGKRKHVKSQCWKNLICEYFKKEKVILKTDVTLIQKENSTSITTQIQAQFSRIAKFQDIKRQNV